MANKPNREKQKAILLKAQEKRKQEKRAQVFRAIEEIQKNGQPLTFPAIAKVAGCSVSYLYKWTELTEYIHDLQRKKTETLNPIEKKTPKPHSLKTLHEASRQRIKELNEEIEELKRQNEALRGHVVEVYELRDECERLRKLVRKYEQAMNQSKVVPLHSPSEEPKKAATTQLSSKPESLSEPEQRSIPEEIEALGIKFNSTLKKAMKNASAEQILNAIEAVKDQMSRNEVKNPAGLLNKAIKEGWTKSESHSPTLTDDDTDKAKKNELSQPEMDSSQELASSEDFNTLYDLLS